MTTRFGIRLLLALACLAAPGCAGPGRRPPAHRDGDQAPGADRGDGHAELERELSLYSD